MEYDPISNWNCRNADPAPEEFKRKLPLRKKQRKPLAVQSLSIDDGINKNPRNFPSSGGAAEVQRNQIGYGKSKIYNEFKVLNKGKF